MKPFLIVLTLIAAGISGPTAKAVSIPAADYKVTYVNGIFGTYGTIAEGAVLRFDANALLEQTPRMLELKNAGESSGPSYLALGDFRLESVLRTKGEIVGYSFFSMQGAHGSGYSLLRFDLRVDWGRMYIVYEDDGIIHGVITLERLSKKESDASNQEPQSRRPALQADAPTAPDR